MIWRKDTLRLWKNYRGEKQMKIYDLRTEYRNNPIGLTVKLPRFSWKMEAVKENTVQNSYRKIGRAHV